MPQEYPHEKMQLYVAPKDFAAVGTILPEGSKVTASGTIGQYHGRPEIKIHSSRQWKW